jgi:hypothetical protein
MTARRTLCGLRSGSGGRSLGGMKVIIIALIAALGLATPTLAAPPAIPSASPAVVDPPADPPTLDSVMKKGEGKLTISEGEYGPDPILTLGALIAFFAILITQLIRHFSRRKPRSALPGGD